MPKITYDSDIFIKHKPAQFPAGFYMSIVVLQELLAGARDSEAIEEFEAAYRDYEKANRLLVPTAEDWWHVGLILNALQRRRRSKKSGLIPKISIGEKYRITNDVLIARTARRAGIAIVTDNIKDFDRIKNFCNVRLIKGTDFFRRRP
ncbi:MAG: type II toxin-antitoxin system VapC family toxin [bacterium]